jgi:hypothetical protein
VSNTLGAGVGFLINHLVGRSIAKHIGGAVSGIDNRKRILFLCLSYAGYLGFVMLLSVSLYYALVFNDWNWDYPLIVGNEPRGTRPWVGTLYRFAIAEGAITEREVEQSFGRDSLVLSPPAVMACDYVFDGAPPFRDRVGRAPALESEGREPFPAEAQGVALAEARWLATAKPATDLSASIFYNPEGFTIYLRLRPGALGQIVHGRIFCIGSDAPRINLALTQEERELCLRLRTMTTGYGGYNPIIAIGDIFPDTLEHSVILTYKQLQLNVYADHVTRRHTFTIGPGLAMFNRFLPSKRKLDITSPFARINDLLFALFAFVPLGFILALIVSRCQQMKICAALVAIAGCALGPYAVERVGLFMIGREIDAPNILMGSAIIGLTLAASLFMFENRETQEISSREV